MNYVPDTVLCALPISKWVLTIPWNKHYYNPSPDEEPMVRDGKYNAQSSLRQQVVKLVLMSDSNSHALNIYDTTTILHVICHRESVYSRLYCSWTITQVALRHRSVYATYSMEEWLQAVTRSLGPLCEGRPSELEDLRGLLRRWERKVDTQIYHGNSSLVLAKNSLLGYA
jgi:hypothetical protein